MIKNFFRIYIALFLFLFIACEDRSLFTELGTDRLEVLFKGTFESNGPTRGWAWDSLTPNDAKIQDDSVIYYTAAPNDEKPTQLMLDVAEMRLNKSKFSNYRQLYNILLNDSESFFNGTGIEMVNDDPRHGASYSHVFIYIRKMLFNMAKKYKVGIGGWEFSDYYYDIFDEKNVAGFNFNKHQVLSIFDTLRLESSIINRVFPLVVPIIGGFRYDKHNARTVLEIRIVVKNFIKKYEYEYFENGVQSVLHYYALSDWLRDVKANETDIGGNILAVARVYVPGQVGYIEGTNNSGQGYIIAIPAGDPITDYSIPDLFRGDNDKNNTTNSNCDLPVFHTKEINNMISIEELLNYYLKYEKYKFDWNSRIESPSSCNTQAVYEDLWTTYNTEITNFRLPPLAVWNTGSSAYTIENVSPGMYDLYHIPVPLSSAAYGKLYYDGEPVMKATVSVSSGYITIQNVSP